MYILIAILIGGLCGLIGRNPILGVLSGIFIWLTLWLCQSTLAWNFSIWIWLVIVLAIGAFMGGYVALGGIMLSIVMLITFATTSRMFHSKRYSSLVELNEVAAESFEQDYVPIDPENMILVDRELAIKYANATLEQDAAIGSICEIHEVNLINLNGTFAVKTAAGDELTLSFDNEQVYIAPLEHRSFWKWSKNRTTPGYVLVSAQRQNVVYFIQEVNGEPLKLRYLESGYFGDYAKRHIRKAGFRRVGLTDYTMEIDDQGRPYMVVTTYKHTIGWGGNKVTGVVVLDVQSGETSWYAPEDAPSWIDRIYPMDFVEIWVNDRMGYVHGFWNRGFAQRDVRQLTPGTSAVYVDGQCYWYTGVQSAGADDATSGFVLVNTRTGKAKLYPIAGVNEQASAEKIATYKIDAANIYPSDLLMYNVRGEATYFATVKGASGEFMGYAFASVQYRDICGVGRSISEAYNAYLKAYRSAKMNIGLDGDVDAIKITATVKAIAFEDGNYYLLFDEIKGKEFFAAPETSKELKWTKVGDQASIAYREGGEISIPLDGFDNVLFNF